MVLSLVGVSDEYLFTETFIYASEHSKMLSCGLKYIYISVGVMLSRKCH